MTGEEAERTTELWLRARRAEGVPLVMVITGRGRRSIGPPVLPGIVEHLLARSTGTMVEHFSVDASGGAFRVHLLPPRRPPPPQPAVAPAADAALLREAEERLLELGVTPTPALLRDEVARIAAERDGREAE